MECKHCGYINDEDALFCIQCGRRMDGKLVCHTCGTVNDDDSKFCKECGNALVSKTMQKKSSSSTDKMKTVKLIMSVISLSYASFILLYCFGACFAPFIQGTNVGYNLFEIISNLQHFRPKPSGVYGSDFYFIGGNLPNIICLVGICISLIGCFICLVYGTVKGIIIGSKKAIPNLNKVAFISTCSLLGGALICGTMCKTYAGSSLFGQSYSQLSLGGIVLSGVILGLIFHFSEYIKAFVLEVIEGMSKEEIINRSFKFGEAILLVILVFNVCSTFIQFLPTGNLSSPQSQYSIMAFFCELSSSISSTISGSSSFQFKGSSVATGFYLAMGMGVVWIILLLVTLVLFVIRLIDAKKIC